MGRNERCWCGSDKKFKLCHLDREQQPPINIFQLVEAMQANFSKGYCSHPNASAETCAKKIISAHTVQRRGGLAMVAEDGHVLSTKFAFTDIVKHNGNPPLRRVGVGSASTFPGFCETHDDALFKPIEGQKFALERDSAFLFSFRAIAFEAFAKAAALKSSEAQREMDRGLPFRRQAQIQQELHVVREGQRRGMADLAGWKAEYDHRILSGRTEGYRYHGVIFEGVLPIVTCCAFHPEFDFNGITLQKISRGDGPFEHLTLNVTAFENRTIAIIGWIGSADGPAAQFTKSFAQVPARRKAAAVIRMAFEISENTFARPDWWAALPAHHREELLRRVHSGMPHAERMADCLVDNAAEYFAMAVASESAS